MSWQLTESCSLLENGEEKTSVPEKQKFPNDLLKDSDESVQGLGYVIFLQTGGDE